MSRDHVTLILLNYSPPRGYVTSLLLPSFYLFTLPEVKFLLLIKLTKNSTTCCRDGNSPLQPWFQNLINVLYEKHHNILSLDPLRASLHEGTF